MHFSRPRLALVFILFSFCAAVPAQAQFNAGIEGTVTDSTGASVGGVTVNVTNQDTGASQQTTTSAGGFYRVSALPPGRYTVSASLEGFREQTLKDVSVSAETVRGVNITLQPGEVKQTVTVTASTEPQLQTENATLSGTITQQQVHDLPQYGRDPYELVRLVPGVMGDGSRQGNGNSANLPNTTGPGGSNLSIFQTENQVPISSAGQRLSDNNFMLDGVSANSLTWGGAAVVTPNQESVQEIQVITNGYSAEYGRNSGATVQVVSKSGSNQVHGSGFFKYDDPGMNAYNKYGGVNAPTVRVNDATRQFGGSIGAPLKKDKIFGFFSYEGLRDNSSNTANVYLFTPQFTQSVIAQRPGGVTAQILNSSGMQPRVISVLPPSCDVGFAPDACQVAGSGLDIGSLSGSLGTYVDDFGTSAGGGLDGIPDLEYANVSVPAQTSGNQYNLRVDYNATSKDTFAVSTYVTQLNQTGADSSTGSTPASDITIQPLNSATTALWNRTISATMLNQARGNFTRYAFNQVQSNPQVNWGIPRLEVQGFPFGRIYTGADRSEATPGILAENTISFSDTLTQVVGNKTLKYGGEITKEQSNNDLLGGARPDIVFQYPWNLANDAPIFEAINVDPSTGLSASAQRYFRTGDYGLFFQTDWKLRPNFTLNLGLRWEYFSPLKEAHGQMSNLVFGSAGLANAKVETESQLYNSDTNNFGPRFGFAYSPARFANKLVLRGGYGAFYNRLPEAVLDNTRGNPPFLSRENICCGTSGSPYVNGQILFELGTSKLPTSYPPNPNLAVGIDPVTGGPAGIAVEIYGAFPDMPNAYVHEWSAGFEYSLPANWVAGINYEGSAGHKVDRLVNQNYLYGNTLAPLPANPGADCATTPSDCFNPFFAAYFLMPDVNTSFNALDSRLTHQFARGLYAQFYYRYSKSIDENSYEGPGFVTNETYPQVLKAERGPSDFDVTHYFTATAVYQLPFLRNRHDLLGSALGGWEIDPVITVRSGFPWTPVSGQSVVTPGGPTLSPTRPAGYSCPPTCPLNEHDNDAFIRPGGNFPLGPTAYFNIAASGPPAIGRNSFRGPNYFGTDVSLAKDTRLPESFHMGEAANLELRANFFNIFNKLNLAPFQFGDASTHIDDPLHFGRATAGLAGRVIELQARLNF